MDLHKLILENELPKTAKEALTFVKAKMVSLGNYHSNTSVSVKSDPYSLRVELVKKPDQDPEDFKDATYDAVKLFNDVAKPFKDLKVGVNKLTSKPGVILTLDLKG